VLFPVWDIIFKTGRWTPDYAATGIHDQIADLESGRAARDYGQTFWAQQWLAVKSMFKRTA
jgi:hypothetical protein